MTTPSTSKWTLDYSPTSSSKVKVQAPPGYVQAQTDKLAGRSSSSSSSVAKPAAATHVDLDELRQQKAWELATSPAKAVPMQAFMMYMSGTGIQIFSIMSVWLLLKQAVGGAMGVQQAFAGFDASVKPKSASSTDAPQSFLQQKAVYVVCQLGLLAVALWKIRSMGLLPDSAEDWAPIFGGWLMSTPVPGSSPEPLGVKVD